MSDRNELIANIDSDEGLKAKRKLLTLASLTLLALSFTGAKLEEANTFIFKITFTNQSGLGAFLCISIAFLIIRYHNYAKPYHDQLFGIWSTRLLSLDFFDRQVGPDYEHKKGILIESLPEEYFDRFPHDLSWNTNYVRKMFFRRYIAHTVDIRTQYEHYYTTLHINIYSQFGLRTYLKVLALECKELIASFSQYRENLDIVTPYMLGVCAIASYPLSNHLVRILKHISTLNWFN
ncbi:hypothetical protein [Vibrio splendidus]|uniref:hypothetical protein n=1 Tax=Vibrio splendidus TaxID=29497 RepID=UPI000769AFA0|nr:hypothetical protein [Vibrio splendidus]PHX06535.1 hypothetical protein VSPL_18250 [Vibrio splendidus]